MNLKSSDISPHLISRLRGPLILAGLLSLVACASAPPPPDEEIQAAQLAISGAVQAGVADFASVELNEARAKLAAAQEAVQREEMVLAERLAEEARVSAELALARSEEVKAREVNEAMLQSIYTLQQEIIRNTGLPR
ncbi:MAG: DUF4398 domain-containing protein [Haliea sp.]